MSHDIGAQAEQAIAVIFSPDHPSQMRQSAQRLLDDIKASETGWKVCAAQYGRTAASSEFRFWCLQVWQDVILGRYDRLPSPDRMALKRLLVGLVLETPMHEPVFVKNKLAQVLILLVHREYPHAWPSFFQDFLGALRGAGPARLDLFFCVLHAVDQEVVSTDIQRTDEERANNTRFKDAMRADCVPAIADAVYQVLITYSDNAPELCVSALLSFRPYIAWIDIALVANDRFVPLLCSFLSRVGLRVAAAECLRTLVCKGMDRMAKLELLRGMNLGHVLSQLDVPQSVDDETEQFSSSIAWLVRMVGLELLDGWSVDDAAAANAAVSQSEEIMGLALRLMDQCDSSVTLTLLELAKTFVSRIPKDTVSQSPQIARQLGLILHVLYRRNRYPEDYDFDAADASPDHMDDVFYQLRLQLDKVYKHIGRVAFDVTAAFVGDALEHALSNMESLPFGDVEAALHFLYSLGEVHREAQTQIEVFGHLLSRVLNSPVASHPHRAVTLIFFEILRRYANVLASRPDLIRIALQAFLGPCGIRHSQPVIQTRVCQLFARLTAAVRIQMVEFTEDILSSIQPFLVVDIDRTVTQVMSSSPLLRPRTQSVPGRQRGAVAVATALASDSGELTLGAQMELYEVAGLLCGAPGQVPDRVVVCMRAILGPVALELRNTIEGLDGQGEGHSRAAIAAAHLINLQSIMTTFARGFNEPSMHPTITEPFSEALQISLGSIRALPRHEGVRLASMTFFHRMVVVLGAAVFPILPSVISELVQVCSVRDLMELIVLLTQLSQRFEAQLAPVIHEVFLVVVRHVYDAASATDSSDPHAMAELGDLQRSYFHWLQIVLSHNLGGVLLSPVHVPHLPGILNSILEALVEHPSIATKRQCVVLLFRLIQAWSNSADSPPGWEQFVGQRIAPCLFQVLLAPAFDLSDPQSIFIVNDIVKALSDALGRHGESLAVMMAGQSLPSIGIDAEASQAVVQRLVGGRSAGSFVQVVRELRVRLGLAGPGTPVMGGVSGIAPPPLTGLN